MATKMLHPWHVGPPHHRVAQIRAF